MYADIRTPAACIRGCMRNMAIDQEDTNRIIIRLATFDRVIFIAFPLAGQSELLLERIENLMRVTSRWLRRSFCSPRVGTASLCFRFPSVSCWRVSERFSNETEFSCVHVDRA